MKRKYNSPLAEIEKFHLQTAITTSTGLDDNPGEENVDDF